MLCSISSPHFYYCQNGGNRTPFLITICVASGSGEMEVNMNVLVTGASGFVGKNIQKHLGNKYELINISTSKNKNYVKISKNFDDIHEKLKDRQIDCIIHLASVIPQNFNATNFKDILLPNAVMFDNLYNFVVEKNIKKFIYISSFGSMEDYKNYKIKDYYTLSKIYGEHVCSMMEARNIQTASLRIPSPYGPYSNPKSVINIFIENALKNLDINVYGSGKREQNFIYVEDIIQAIELFINAENRIDGVYSIVSEKNTSMVDLAQMVKEICNSKSKIIVGKLKDSQENFRPQYDCSRAHNKTGYKPNYNIYTGLKKYIEWYVNNI